MEGSCVAVRVQEIARVEDDSLHEALKLAHYGVLEATEPRDDL
ncbi:hypothetical protein RK21_05799 [Pseudomonas plecoglossicida]|nr:hypothetical protein RK21_05799 [Pseudomonas plecoglossicida]